MFTRCFGQSAVESECSGVTVKPLTALSVTELTTSPLWRLCSAMDVGEGWTVPWTLYSGVLLSQLLISDINTLLRRIGDQSPAAYISVYSQYTIY